MTNRMESSQGCARVLRERKPDAKSNNAKYKQKFQNVVQKRSFGDRKENCVPVAPKKEKVVMSKFKRRKIFGSLKENTIECNRGTGDTKNNNTSKVNNNDQCRRVENNEKSATPSTPRTAVSDLSMSSPQSAFLKKLLADKTSKSTISNSSKSRKLVSVVKPTFCMRDTIDISPRANQATMLQTLQANKEESSYVPPNVVEFRASLNTKDGHEEGSTTNYLRSKLASAATATKSIINLLECRIYECFVPTPTSPICSRNLDQHDMHSI